MRVFSWGITAVINTCKRKRLGIKISRAKQGKGKKIAKETHILNDTSLTFYLLHTKGFLLTMEFYMKSNLMHTVENLIFKDAAENLRQCI